MNYEAIEATMASEATKMAIIGNMHIYSKVMEVIEHHMPISHSPCRRRSKGPLPSGLMYSMYLKTAIETKVNEAELLTAISDQPIGTRKSIGRRSKRIVTFVLLELHTYISFHEKAIKIPLLHSPSYHK